MKKTFIRIIGDDEINIDTAQDFIDDQGNRHPRNVLWLWSEDELWDVLHIKVIWQADEPADMLALDPIQIPKPPAPVPSEPWKPAEPALPPAPMPPPLEGTHRFMEAKKLVTPPGEELDPDTVAKLKVLTHTDAEIGTLVAYGGIAFRTLRIAKKGGYHQGHRHNYDHMTNLVKGSVLCEVENAKPKAYHAPCQITVAADHWHKFTALEDDVVYQCVYRQPEREDLYTVANSPYNLAPFTAEELIEKLKTAENPCAHCDCATDTECGTESDPS